MQADYWDRLAASFEQDVFNPVANDLEGTITSTLSNLACKNHSVADIGCGTGRNLPLLGLYFRSTLALDISESCLHIARNRHRRLNSVQFLQHDLTRPLPDIEQVNVGVCLNVALMPDFRCRMSLLKNVTKLIRPDGRLLMLVPAMESVLLTVHRLVQWNLEEHKTYQQAAAAATSELGFTACSVRDGVVEKGGTATKHYLREELELLLPSLGHQVCDIAKVQYSWDTEFEDPPASMGAPYPWDWLVISTPLTTSGIDSD